MKKKHFIPIPFNMMPGSWGLSGQAFDEAEAAYYYEGETLARKLTEIRTRPGVERDRKMLDLDFSYKHITEYEYDCRLLELDGRGADTMAVLANEHKHGRITDRDYLEAQIRETYTGRDREKALIELRLSEGDLDQYDAAKAILMLDDDSKERAAALIALDLEHNKTTPYDAEKAAILLGEEGVERDLAALALDLKHEKIKQREHDKQVATLKEEPWVGVIDDGFDLNQGVNGLYFELDWNQQWITYLRMNGYGGHTEDQIIEAWFADVCRTYVSESQGESDFTPRPGRMVNRIDRGDGYADYT
ncbi:MAG: hypothetical protein EOO77_11050 [Oxalobacteraceae bacterium]|nr:MAG: hypothetical protein EOO77_11050 [Oxalobacteraceae bacterium]